LTRPSGARHLDWLSHRAMVAGGLSNRSICYQFSALLKGVFTPSAFSVTGFCLPAGSGREIRDLAVVAKYTRTAHIAAFHIDHHSISSHADEPRRHRAGEPLRCCRIGSLTHLTGSLDWRDFVDRYDRPGTLFYLDPPYFGSEDYYGKALFGRDQFAAMAERLSKLKGRFILSINDVPEIRELFGGCQIQPVELPYSVAGGKGTNAQELIIEG